MLIPSGWSARELVRMTVRLSLVVNGRIAVEPIRRVEVEQSETGSWRGYDSADCPAESVNRAVNISRP